LINDNL